jgi:prepilin-type N-terminal cleavage/methylation domain-containing protein
VPPRAKPALAWPPPRLGARGFTLVELVVVVAIIGVLVALLVPASGYAIEEARMAECCTNLRSLGVGVLLYAKDHDGNLPVSGQLDGPHPALVAALKGYIQEPRVCYCPSETKPEFVFSEANAEAGCIGYFYFSCEQTPTNPLLSTFLRWNVKWPRRLYTGMNSRTWVLSDRWSSGEPTAHRMYKKGVNYVTLSGDVQTVTESPRDAFE